MGINYKLKTVNKFVWINQLGVHKKILTMVCALSANKDIFIQGTSASKFNFKILYAILVTHWANVFIVNKD